MKPKKKALSLIPYADPIEPQNESGIEEHTQQTVEKEGKEAVLPENNVSKTLDGQENGENEPPEGGKKSFSEKGEGARIRTQKNNAALVTPPGSDTDDEQSLGLGGNSKEAVITEEEEKEANKEDIEEGEDGETLQIRNDSDIDALIIGPEDRKFPEKTRLLKICHVWAEFLLLETLAQRFGGCYLRWLLAARYYVKAGKAISPEAEKWCMGYHEYIENLANVLGEQITTYGMRKYQFGDNRKLVEDLVIVAILRRYVELACHYLEGCVAVTRKIRVNGVDTDENIDLEVLTESLSKTEAEEEGNTKKHVNFVVNHWPLDGKKSKTNGYDLLFKYGLGKKKAVNKIADELVLRSSGRKDFAGFVGWFNGGRSKSRPDESEMKYLIHLEFMRYLLGELAEQEVNEIANIKAEDVKDLRATLETMAWNLYVRKISKNEGNCGLNLQDFDIESWPQVHPYEWLRLDCIETNAMRKRYPVDELASNVYDELLKKVHNESKLTYEEQINQLESNASKDSTNKNLGEIDAKDTFVEIVKIDLANLSIEKVNEWAQGSELSEEYKKFLIFAVQVVAWVKLKSIAPTLFERKNP